MTAAQWETVVRASASGPSSFPEGRREFEGVTALVATHDPNLIDIADSVLILEDGQIKQ